jgi:hypothetical protein
MKAILFSLMLLVAIFSSAQEVTIYRLNNTGTYPGKQVPAYVKTHFEKTYPGMTVTAWEPVNAMWRATYNDNNRVVHVYYNEWGNHYRSILPVVQNNVPEDVVTTALTRYGPVVYAITKMKGADDAEVYQLKLIEKGISRSVWMDASGTEVTKVFRTADDDDAKVVIGF